VSRTAKDEEVWRSGLGGGSELHGRPWRALAPGAPGSGKRERASGRGSGEDGEELGLRAGRARGARTHGSKARRGSRMVDTFGMRGVHAVTTSTSCQHVASDEVARVGHRFGLAKGRVWT
jgi:hypothetical protein